MPLLEGHSHEVVSQNIKELVKSGKPMKQAIAIALAEKRKVKKMAEGGEVEPEALAIDALNDMASEAAPEEEDEVSEEPSQERVNPEVEVTDDLVEALKAKKAKRRFV